MIYLLLAVIASPLLVLRHPQRLYPAFVYVLGVGVHHALFGASLGDTYFHTAALFDALVALFIMSQWKDSVARYLAGLSVVSMVGNFYGWMLWYSYLNPQPYQNLFIAIYISAIGVILTGGPDGWATLLSDIRNPRVSCPHSGSRPDFYEVHGGEG